MSHPQWKISSLGPEMKTALQVVKLDRGVMKAVAHDSSKTKFGMAILVVAAVLGMIGQQWAWWSFPHPFLGDGMAWVSPSQGTRIASTVLQLIEAVVGIYVPSLIAQKLFGGKAGHEHFFRAASYGMIVTWVGLLPALMPLANLWSVAVFFVLLREVHQLSSKDTILVLVLSLLAMGLVHMGFGLLDFNTGWMMGRFV